MNTIHIKKVIFFIFLLINLSPSGKAKGFNSFNGENKFKTNNKIIWSKVISRPKELKIKKLFDKYPDNLSQNSIDKNFTTIKSDSGVLFANNSNNKDEIEIQSEIQSEKNNILYAEGNVLVSYRAYILKADTLIYDKSKKKLNAKGNISLIIGEQIFKMNSFEYDFKDKKGYLLNVIGFINTNNLINDIYENFDSPDIQKIESLQDIKKIKVLNTPNKIENWIFLADKIEIDDEKWKSKKALFTNDLLELNQVKIVVNSLEAKSKKEELRFKSSLNYLILDEKLSIPFWFGDRNLKKSSEGFTFTNRWNIGFENVDKDGYFIGRKFNSISLFNDFVLDLEPQFLIQRSLKGHTKSFVNKGDSITADKVKRDTTFVDYFALNSRIKGNINNWNLEIGKELNSFDSEKLLNALRANAKLSKEITFLNSNWDKSFFLVYRDRIWNGSIGEAEIYGGYGTKLEKLNTWEVGGITNTEALSIGFGNFKGEALNSRSLVTSLKGNLFYSLEKKIPIYFHKPLNNFVDSSFKYIAKPIKRGFNLNTKLELSYSFYKSGNHQEHVGLGAGPEFIFGNFKNKSFDYTRISFLPFYKLKSGDSMFKFDQISDIFTLDIAFDQQLYGPLILKSNAILNLDSNSKDYGEFINSKISLNWKKRSYEFGVFYQPHNESGGISFKLFGFK